jgi:hypothetical protein
MHKLPSPRWVLRHHAYRTGRLPTQYQAAASDYLHKLFFDSDVFSDQE